MHSNTRNLLFGPEEQFHRYLGYAFAVLTMPNTFGLSRELMMWNTPGRAAALYATGDSEDELHAFLNFHQPQQPLTVLRNPDAQRDLVTQIYAGAGWEVAGIVKAMREADDLFFDTAGQIRMSTWSSGRIALVGDAAYAPSFLTGQGTSLALVGAYLLANALAANRDHTAAFAAYERDTRGFVAINQALVDNGGATLFPYHCGCPGATQRQATRPCGHAVGDRSFGLLGGNPAPGAMTARLSQVDSTWNTLSSGKVE